MYQIHNDITAILLRLRAGVILSEEDRHMLDRWLSDSPLNQQLLEEIMDDERWNKDLMSLLDRDEQSIWNKISPHIQGEISPVKQIRKQNPWYKYAAAAVVLGLIAGVLYFKESVFEKANNSSVVSQSNEADIPPGGNKAMLTLSDGSSISLDGAANGELTREGQTVVNKLKEGEIVYDAANSKSFNQKPLTFNILSTPRGGQYKIVLQDGSKVWLNAASSLRYPTSFNGNDRVVELKGEAYFEVAPYSGDQSSGSHSRLPFIVHVNGMKIDVLGTIFNVKAYQEEPEMKTTLAEGSVRVSMGSRTCLLKPAQQVSVTNTVLYADRPASFEISSNVVTEVDLAWKDGYFYFKGSSIEDVMGQLGRWYSVSVRYKGLKPKGHYSGKISRNTQLSEVLAVLKLSGINASLQNKEIIVLD